MPTQKPTREAGHPTASPTYQPTASPTAITIFGEVPSIRRSAVVNVLDSYLIWSWPKNYNSVTASSLWGFHISICKPDDTSWCAHRYYNRSEVHFEGLPYDAITILCYDELTNTENVASLEKPHPAPNQYWHGSQLPVFTYGALLKIEIFPVNTNGVEGPGKTGTIHFAQSTEYESNLDVCCSSEYSGDQCLDLNSNHTECPVIYRPPKYYGSHRKRECGWGSSYPNPPDIPSFANPVDGQTYTPTELPTGAPSPTPTQGPTGAPSISATPAPSPSPTERPSTSPTGRPTEQPVCVGDRQTWDAGFGSCTTYILTPGDSNHAYCDTDCQDGFCAVEVCRECNFCDATNAPTSLPTAVPTAFDPLASVEIREEDNVLDAVVLLHLSNDFSADLVWGFHVKVCLRSDISRCARRYYPLSDVYDGNSSQDPTIVLCHDELTNTPNEAAIEKTHPVPNEYWHGNQLPPFTYGDVLTIEVFPVNTDGVEGPGKQPSIIQYTQSDDNNEVSDICCDETIRPYRADCRDFAFSNCPVTYDPPKLYSAERKRQCGWGSDYLKEFPSIPTFAIDDGDDSTAAPVVLPTSLPTSLPTLVTEFNPVGSIYVQHRDNVLDMMVSWTLPDNFNLHHAWGFHVSICLRNQNSWCAHRYYPLGDVYDSESNDYPTIVLCHDELTNTQNVASLEKPHRVPNEYWHGDQLPHITYGTVLSIEVFPVNTLGVEGPGKLTSFGYYEFQNDYGVDVCCGGGDSSDDCSGYSTANCPVTYDPPKQYNADHKRACGWGSSYPDPSDIPTWFVALPEPRTFSPTAAPTGVPSQTPTAAPTPVPPTGQPTVHLTSVPSSQPSISDGQEPILDGDGEDCPFCLN